MNWPGSVTAKMAMKWSWPGERGAPCLQGAPFQVLHGAPFQVWASHLGEANADQTLAPLDTWHAAARGGIRRRVMSGHRLFYCSMY